MAASRFLALHVDGETVLRVQLKSRLAFQEKYRGKVIWIAFGSGEDWYLYPHDELLEKVLAVTTIRTTQSWSERGGYAFPGIPKAVRPFLERYRIAGTVGAIPEWRAIPTLSASPCPSTSDSGAISPKLLDAPGFWSQPTTEALTPICADLGSGTVGSV